MSGDNKKRRLSAIDYFLIFAVIAALLAGGLRIYDDLRSDDPGSDETVDTMEEYLVTFRSAGMRSSTAKLLEKGDVFFLTGGKTEFGVLEDNVSVMPAEIYIELENGDYIKTYAEENGDNTRVDVTGTFRIRGNRNANGLLYVGGVFCIAPNLDVTVYDLDMSLSFKVTGIEKVS